MDVILYTATLWIKGYSPMGIYKFDGEWMFITCGKECSTTNWSISAYSEPHKQPNYIKIIEYYE